MSQNNQGDEKDHVDPRKDISKIKQNVGIENLVPEEALSKKVNEEVFSEDMEYEKNLIIGSRIKSIRLLLGFTQSTFSDLMNVTFQQVQKYEKGLNRISAIALWKLSKKLGINISYFFPKNNQKDSPKDLLSVSEKFSFFDFDHENIKNSSQIKEINHLLTQFKRLKSTKVRKRVISLVQTIADSEQEPLNEEERR